MPFNWAIFPHPVTTIKGSNLPGKPTKGIFLKQLLCLHSVWAAQKLIGIELINSSTKHLECIEDGKSRRKYSSSLPSSSDDDHIEYMGMLRLDTEKTDGWENHDLFM
ncbi:hypothetical protein H257_17394 [Aphanomyces astaci]|uniref:Uncharacterized protein n=1 Tax=Aphanomyces astaci TaxID=112090 RepID=W4FF61_APHAT|nr:hypothetical protein H257_17394 [Aphanomyces astaci]ETV66065.1 hypothetical protein H257_17394 [Aphanomyces astaci]|eukprot:XP_009844494.1 hypothetical protein H257_17394 [Aphanomyces astaci]